MGCEDTFDVRTRKWTVRLPMVEGFADYLRVHRDTLYRWARTYPEYRRALDHLMLIQYLRLVEGGLSGRYKTRLVILMLMRNHSHRFRYSKQDLERMEINRVLDRFLVPVRR